jgi:hypothetical protein
MPSAENASSAKVVKLESTAKLESDFASNQKMDEEKQVPAIQQVISIISNKVRNLEKRKVSEKFNWRPKNACLE